MQKLTDEHVEADRRAAEAQGSRDHGGLSRLTRTRSLDETAASRPVARVARRRDHHGRQRPLGRARGLPVAEGHRAGTRALRRTVEAAIDLGDRVARRLRVLDRELDAARRRGRDADGDLRRDDRARAARSRRAGRAHALHRPPRPRSRRRCASRWSALEAETARERHGSSSGSPSTTAAGPRSSRPRAGSSRTGVAPERGRRGRRSRRASTRRSCPTPTC